MQITREHQSFITYAEKLIDEHYSDEPQIGKMNVAIMVLMSMETPREEFEKPIKMLGKYKDRKDSDEFDRIIKVLDKRLEAFKKEFKMQLQNVKMKAILELCWPLLANSARSRHLHPDNPLCLARVVKDIVENKDNTFNEFKMLNEYGSLSLAILKALQKGDKPDKRMVRRVNELRLALNIEAAKIK